MKYSARILPLFRSINKLRLRANYIAVTSQFTTARIYGRVENRKKCGLPLTEKVMTYFMKLLEIEEINLVE